MNYPRHFELGRRVRLLTAVAFVSVLVLLVFSTGGLLARPGTRQNILMTIAGLSLIAAVTCLHLIIAGVHELERLEREDREEKPWRSQPRISHEDLVP